MSHRARRLIWVLAVMVVALPVFRAAADRLSHGYPEGDDATIVLFSQDSLSHDPPLVGMVSTGGAGLENPELHHPGPAEFYLLAPLVRFGPGLEPGATASVVALALASLGGLVLALRAVGGRNLAAAGLVASGLVLWGVGWDPPASVWNPYVVVLPFTCLLGLTAACAAGRVRFLPAAVIVASAVAQTHLGYAPLSAVLALWAVVVVVWRHRRDLAAVRGVLAMTAALGVLIWLPPIIQQLTGHPGNLTQLARAAAHGTGQSVGAAGLGELGRVAGVPVAGLRPIDALVRVLPPLSAGWALLAALPFGIAVGLTVVARRRGQADRAAVAATVAVAYGAGAFTASRLPLADGVLYQYYGLWMWPLAAVGWLLLGWVWFGLSRLRLLTPEPSPRGSRAFAAVGLVLLVGIGLLPRPQPWEPWQAYRRIAHRVAPEAARGVPRGGRYLVRFRGATAYLSTGSAIVADLDQAGSEVFVDPGAPTPVFPWRHFRHYDGEWIDAEIWVVSGADPTDLPVNARLVASSPTLTATEAARQRARSARLEALVRRAPPAPGPRAATTAAERAAVAAARNDPLAALRSGALADLASRGLLEPPGGDLQTVVTDARMRGLLAEGSVRVYDVPRQRS